MIREMAPIMTAIIMAGRTGAAYAAEIGTMKVNEEIDALTTLGINPIDFLVTPRMLALVLMIPPLTMYASLMGIIGGAHRRAVDDRRELRAVRAADDQRGDARRSVHADC